jgi:universal stress protein E
MRWAHVMFSVPSLGEIAPIEMDKVCKLTAGLGAELELFHCIFDPDVARPGRFGTRGAQEDIHEFIERRRQQLEIAAGRLRARGLSVRTSIRWDYPTHEGIVRQVLRHRPDLLIAGTTRAGRLTLARTDFRLIETCPCPVLFMKTHRPYSDVVIAAALDPTLAHGKPAALDLAILDSAGSVRDALCARLLVLHAKSAHERASAAARGEPDSRLLALAARYDIPHQRVHLLEGHPAEILPGLAERQKTDIVVMGATARSPLRRALIGHTAERLLDTLESDVLVVKAPGFQAPVRRQSTHHVEKSPALRSQYIF